MRTAQDGDVYWQLRRASRGALKRECRLARRQRLHVQLDLWVAEFKNRGLVGRGGCGPVDPNPAVVDHAGDTRGVVVVHLQPEAAKRRQVKRHTGRKDHRRTFWIRCSNECIDVLAPTCG